MIKKIFFNQTAMCLSLFCIVGCQYVTRQSDNIARKDFVKSVVEHYGLNYVMDHFPDSWDNESLRSLEWSAYYCPCSENAHTFYGVFSDKISLNKIDSIEQGITFMYKTPYKNDSVLKIDIVYIDNENSCLQNGFDTMLPPIWDFRTASFLLGEEKDSILVNGNYWCNDKEILPNDLMIYVTDAKSGNFWRDKTKAEQEPRPTLPGQWRHGYSRGIAVSHSCQRVAWWIMAW